MPDKLPPPALLTQKQAEFVECMARGMSAKDAYKAAYQTDANDNAVRADASKLRRNPAVALALRELLRSRRLADMDSIGELVADTKADQEAARQAGAHAAVVAANRLRGNWLGVERQTLVLRPESLMSDEELIERLGGGDPERLAAARNLLGAGEGFSEPQCAEFEVISTQDATHDEGHS